MCLLPPSIPKCRQASCSIYKKNRENESKKEGVSVRIHHAANLIKLLRVFVITILRVNLLVKIAKCFTRKFDCLNLLVSSMAFYKIVQKYSLVLTAVGLILWKGFIGLTLVEKIDHCMLSLFSRMDLVAREQIVRERERKNRFFANIKKCKNSRKKIFWQLKGFSERIWMRERWWEMGRYFFIQKNTTYFGLSNVQPCKQNFEFEYL